MPPFEKESGGLHVNGNVRRIGSPAWPRNRVPRSCVILPSPPIGHPGFLIARAAFALAAVLLVVFIPPVFGVSAPYPQARQPRPKVKVIFDRPNLQINYGETIDLCMKVVPTPFVFQFEFASAPVGVLEATFGGIALCLDPGSASVQVKATTEDCTSPADLKLLARVARKTVGILPTTVLLPDDENHTLVANYQDLCSTGFNQQFFLTFTSKASGTPNFKGLPVTEIQDFTGLQNTCGLTPHFTTWTMGTPNDLTPRPLGPNQIDDTNSFCGSILGGAGEIKSCVTQIGQRFRVGACLTPQYVHIFRVNASGVGCVQRGDPLAQGGTPGDCPP